VNSLFARPEGVEVGDYFINIDMEKSDEHHPMRKVKVIGIDNTGMVHLMCAIPGLGGMSTVISSEGLKTEYRKYEEV